jgi:hypothetical protein
MEFVLVHGVPVIEKGKMTGALPGKVLRAGRCFRACDVAHGARS